MLTYDLDLGTKEKILPQGIHMCNIKALLLTIQKSRDKLDFFVDKQKQSKRETVKLRDRQTGQKLYAPNLLLWGHKKIF